MRRTRIKLCNVRQPARIGNEWNLFDVAARKRFSLILPISNVFACWICPLPYPSNLFLNQSTVLCAYSHSFSLCVPLNQRTKLSVIDSLAKGFRITASIGQNSNNKKKQINILLTKWIRYYNNIRAIHPIEWIMNLKCFCFDSRNKFWTFVNWAHVLVRHSCYLIFEMLRKKKKKEELWIKKLLNTIRFLLHWANQQHSMRI